MRNNDWDAFVSRDNKVMILHRGRKYLYRWEESAWFKRCDEILRWGKCKRASSDAPFIISVSRSVAILQFISVSVYPRSPDTHSYYPISRGDPPPDGHIKFLIKRWIDRNKWKDAVFEPAERPGEKSVSAFQYSQVVPRAFARELHHHRGDFSCPCTIVHGNKEKVRFISGERY